MSEPRSPVPERLLHPITEQNLRRFFIQWYRQHGRAFPWRSTGVSPFGMLVAEMLLRQTRAEMVAPVWTLLLERYPTPAACAMASEQELYTLVAPLGLGAQRVAAIQSASRQIVHQHQGKVPSSIEALMSLPHLGLYASHAIVCFAYFRRVPVVDVNVLRLFSRLTGEELGRDNRRAPLGWKLAWEILPRRFVRQHNLGLLDFTAQICKPGIPDCDACLLATQCNYGLSCARRQQRTGRKEQARPYPAHTGSPAP